MQPIETTTLKCPENNFTYFYSIRPNFDEHVKNIENLLKNELVSCSICKGAGIWIDHSLDAHECVWCIGGGYVCANCSSPEETCYCGR